MEASSEAEFETKAQAFSAQLVSILNDGILGLMISLGHKLGLFDTLSGLPWSTSEQIARIAGLNERYVREWLGGMTVGRIVEYNPEDRTFRLPPEHAASLTQSAGVDNLAMFFQYIHLMGSVEDQVAEAFRNGGGVPYAAFPHFQRLQAEETARIFDHSLVDRIIPLIPGLRETLERGAEVLDIGSGTGRAMTVLARAFPNSRFRGIDLSEEGVATGREEASRLELTNVQFDQADAADLTDQGRYDLITAFDSIHDMARPTQALQAIHRALKDGGVFLMQDIDASSNLEENLDHPMAPTLFGFSTFHCMTVSLAQDGEALGTVWGRQLARAKLSEAGFREVDIKTLPDDILNCFYISRKR